MAENNESRLNEENNKTGDKDYAYKSVLKKEKKARRTWSVVALILSIASILFLPLPAVSLTLAVLAIGLAALSRFLLGYFDRFAVGAMIVAIFGIVFSISGLIFGHLLENLF